MKKELVGSMMVLAATLAWAGDDSSARAAQEVLKQFEAVQQGKMVEAEAAATAPFLKKPTDPVYEKWLPILNANKAMKPRPIPEPLPQMEVTPGPFKPDWNDAGWLKHKCPDWLYEGKIGIGSHWGPCTVPAKHPWYFWAMYRAKDGVKDWHVKTYGHPANFGYKEFANLFRPDKFDPDELAGFFKKCGFKFIAPVAAHHDRYDMWDSTYYPWNSVNTGPHRDILGDWKNACDKHGLRFGITDHATWWDVYKGAFGADKDGPWAGIPYDGSLTRADGKGKWWEGLDPRDLYGTAGRDSVTTQRHRWYLRMGELFEKYHPDLFWQDGGTPFGYTKTDEHMNAMIAADYYNRNTAWHKGQNEGLVVWKNITSQPAIMLDYEIGKSAQTLPYPWMSDTTMHGPWFYTDAAEKGALHSPDALVQNLCDIVSKNGTLLLNISLRADGTLPQPQREVLEKFGRWMAINGEAIYGARPWRIFGEGPTLVKDGAGGQTWGPFTPRDNRFTVGKNGALYLIVLGIPAGDVDTEKLGKSAGDEITPIIEKVTLLGSDEKLDWSQDWRGLHIRKPKQWPCEHAVVFKVSFGDDLKR